MEFINLLSTSDVEYSINRSQITFITINKDKNTVIQLSCGTVIEVKESIDFILNS